VLVVFRAVLVALHHRLRLRPLCLVALEVALEEFELLAIVPVEQFLLELSRLLLRLVPTDLLHNHQLLMK
jgi:hypothetical protein